LIFTGEKQSDKPKVIEIRFSPERVGARTLRHDELPASSKLEATWFDIRGLHDITLIEAFGRIFKMHPLILEDILNTQQRPKFEEYDTGIFIVVSGLTYNTESQTLISEQLSLYFGKDYLLTFQENPDDTFAVVRERIEAGKGRIRSRGTDYLAYAVMDSIVDNYFVVLDQFEESLDSLELEITESPTKLTKEKIHQMKYQLLVLRRTVMQLREAINRFSKAESKLIDPETEVFIRDLYDHIIRIADIIDTYRDMANGLQELYLSELSHRMNNIIRALTIITTIFVPLNLLAGLYGMNFDKLPGMHNDYGFTIVVAFMAFITLCLLLLFRRMKWL
jgi:magnesium transporter